MYGMMGKDNPLSETAQEMQDRRRASQEEINEQMMELLRQDPRSMKPLVMNAAKRFKLTRPQIAAISMFAEPSQAPNLMKTGPGMGRG